MGWVHLETMGVPTAPGPSSHPTQNLTLLRIQASKTGVGVEGVSLWVLLPWFDITLSLVWGLPCPAGMPQLLQRYHTVPCL